MFLDFFSVYYAYLAASEYSGRLGISGIFPDVRDK